MTEPITAFELALLRQMCGLPTKGGPIHLGAAMAAGLESLMSRGLVHVVRTLGRIDYQPTAAGRALAERGK